MPSPLWVLAADSTRRSPSASAPGGIRSAQWHGQDGRSREAGELSRASLIECDHRAGPPPGPRRRRTRRRLVGSEARGRPPVPSRPRDLAALAHGMNVTRSSKVELCRESTSVARGPGRFRSRSGTSRAFARSLGARESHPFHGTRRPARSATVLPLAWYARRAGRDRRLRTPTRSVERRLATDGVGEVQIVFRHSGRRSSSARLQLARVKGLSRLAIWSATPGHLTRGSDGAKLEGRGGMEPVAHRRPARARTARPRSPPEPESTCSRT